MCRLMAYIGPPRLIADVVLCKSQATCLSEGFSELIVPRGSVHELHHPFMTCAGSSAVDNLCLFTLVALGHPCFVHLQVIQKEALRM